ncbi:MAG: hemerythrin domain-containing protein [Betaproteobacteria bacterium]|nr:hemerythrin domain-containing protein [Betaproteobacteria bacterium]
MDFNRHISRRLHEEHEATLALWGRLEQALAMRGAKPPTEEDLRLVRDCTAQIADEVTRHFAFEEKDLFPLLAASGEGDIAGLLAEEHATIREAARRFGELAQPSADLQARWPEARALALELAERLVSHVQKEEMSLLPSLEDLLDEETDQALAGSYV